MLRRPGDFETRISAISRVLFSRFSMFSSAIDQMLVFLAKAHVASIAYVLSTLVFIVAPCLRNDSVLARCDNRTFYNRNDQARVQSLARVIFSNDRYYFDVVHVTLFQAKSREPFLSALYFFLFPFFTVCFFFPIRSTSCSVNPSYSSSGKHREFCSLLLRNIAEGTSVYSFLWLPKDTLGSCVDRQ